MFLKVEIEDFLYYIDGTWEDKGLGPELSIDNIETDTPHGKITFTDLQIEDFHEKHRNLLNDLTLEELEHTESEMMKNYEPVGNGMFELKNTDLLG